MKAIVTAAAALALMSAAMAAKAAPITVDFTVVSNDVSNPSYALGVMGTGHFTFDDSLVPSGGSGGVGNPISGLATLDLAFNWFGVSFDGSNASIATLSFSNGSLIDWMLGGSYLPPVCGFLRYGCVSSAGTQPDFTALGSGGSSLADAVRPGIAYGPVQWSVRSAAVPEPTTLGLLLGGVACLTLSRRRHIPAATASG